jgi:SAM-dependent methyltransferase
MPSDGELPDHRAANLANWEQRAPVHAASPDYSFEQYVGDPGFIGSTVQFDRPLLGDVGGLRGVHLQCHIGTDTLSLARLGARMSGLDFSPASLEQARLLADRAGVQIDYHQADVYDALQVFEPGSFDLVYTGIGALGWLPRIRDWAEVVAGLLRPGGRLFIREAHPVLWALDEARPDRLLALEYPYFEQVEPTEWDDPGTYVSTDVVLTATKTYDWNHGLGEIVGSLLAAGMEITGLVEHQSVPWEALPGQMTRRDDGEWQLTDRPWRLPHTYTLQAVRRR